ncbi:MAG: PTS sugar transporter subunit IIB [Tissierellales bacterium]|jgi:PTS system ascorbate-specific IIB component|nr:PTS sugar transporter subunit IIB [Tissierellales bacterium]
MLKVLAACGNGMGSSMIIKMKIEKVLKEMGIEYQVHHCSVGQATSDAKNFDVVLVSQAFVKDFSNAGNAKVIGLLNLLSEDEIKTKLQEALA